jgi:uncharacterized membrane protein
MKACEEFTDLLTITLVNTDGIANSKDYQLEICTPRLVVVCILLFTGWKGWEMVYRHRVGVESDTPHQTTASAPRRAA